MSCFTDGDPCRLASGDMRQAIKSLHSQRQSMVRISERDTPNVQKQQQHHVQDSRNPLCSAVESAAGQAGAPTAVPLTQQPRIHRRPSIVHYTSAADAAANRAAMPTALNLPAGVEGTGLLCLHCSKNCRPYTCFAFKDVVVRNSHIRWVYCIATI